MAPGINDISIGQITTPIKTGITFFGYAERLVFGHPNYISGKHRGDAKLIPPTVE